MNLKRHYNLVTIIYILLLFSNSINIFEIVLSGGYMVSFRVLLSLAYILLLIVTLIFIVGAREPWQNNFVEFFIWFSILVGLAIKTALPIVLKESWTYGPVAIYAAFGLYIMILKLKEQKL